MELSEGTATLGPLPEAERGAHGPGGDPPPQAEEGSRFPDRRLTPWVDLDDNHGHVT